MPDDGLRQVTASYRTVGVDPERMVFAYTTDPVKQRGYLQTHHQVQLRLYAIYYGVPTYAIEDKFAELIQDDGSYLVSDDLLEHLATLHVEHFDGRTKKPRRKGTRRGGRSRVYQAMVDDLPDTCGVVACARILSVDYRTVHAWIARHGLQVAQHGRRVVIARETLRTWLRQTYRLIGSS